MQEVEEGFLSSNYMDFLFVSIICEFIFFNFYFILEYS